MTHGRTRVTRVDIITIAFGTKSFARVIGKHGFRVALTGPIGVSTVAITRKVTIHMSHWPRRIGVARTGWHLPVVSVVGRVNWATGIDDASKRV